MARKKRAVKKAAEAREPGYRKLQETWMADNGIKVGSRVLIARQVDSNTRGWSNSWVDRMTPMVGKVGVVEDKLGGNLGIDVSVDGDIWAYPYFALGAMEEPKAEKALPGTARACDTCRHLADGPADIPCRWCGGHTKSGRYPCWEALTEMDEITDGFARMARQAGGHPRAYDALWKVAAELVDMLEAEEESDSGSVFRPTHISSCRTADVIRLTVLWPKLRGLVRKLADG